MNLSRPSRQSSVRQLAPWCAVILAVAFLAGLMVPPSAQGYLTDTASHPPPASGPYGYDTFTPGSAGFPAVGETYTDPVFGETIRRLTNDIAYGTGDSEIYSKNGFVNADNTLMYHRKGDGSRHIIDATTGANVCDLPLAGFQGSDGSFDPNDPTVWYYFNGPELRRYIVSAGSCQLDPNPVKVFAASLGSLGGSVDWIDASGRYMVLNIGGNVQVWDNVADQLYTGSFDYNAYAENGAGWVGISPDGKYLITAGAGPTHYSFALNHVSKALGAPVLFWTMCGGHADVVSASDGKTYYVSHDCNSKGDIYRVDVTIPQSASNTAKQLADNLMIVDIDAPPGEWDDVAGHFSGVSKGPMIDWMYVSISSGDDPFNGGVSPWRRYKSEIFMVNVLTGEIRRLAHHRSRSVYQGYVRHPRVNTSWDGGIVSWSSNFNLILDPPPPPGDPNSDQADYGDIYSIAVPTGGGGGGDTTPPTVSMTEPGSGATVSGTTTVAATASDNIGVVGVQFKVNGENVDAEDTTAPYSVNWDTTQVADGAHTLTAVARDAAGNMTTSSGVSVTVSNGTGGGGDTTPPTVSVAEPADGSTVSATIAVSATAADDVGVVGVQFKLDGQNLEAEDTTAPYSVSWDTTTATDGSHTLAAVARDAAGNTTTSSVVTVTVANGGGDTTPPTVAVTEPADGATVSGTMAVSATASDDVGVVGVQFKLDGQNLEAEDTTVPYSVSWDTTQSTFGTHSLTAVARDAAGNQTTSTAITVTVSQGGLTPENVVWVSGVNVVVNGNAITKNGGCDGCWDAGAISQQTIGSGDGYLEFTASADIRLTAGLSNGNTGTSADEIKWGLRLYPTQVEVRESGVWKAGWALEAGAVYKVAVEGGVVKYYQNGALKHTSEVAATYPLLVDATIETLDGSLQNAVIARAGGGGGGGSQGVTWASPVNVAVSGSTITKNGGCEGCWDAGAISQQTIGSGDGYFEFTASAGVRLTAGLSNGNTGTSADEIKWALRLYPTQVEVRESGVWKASWTLEAGAVYKVAVEGGVVKYYQNGVLKHTSEVAPTYPLLVDATIETLDGSLQNAVISGGSQGVTWASPVNVAVSGSTITKNGGCEGCWDAGAISQQTIASGDGSVEFMASSGVRLTAGLSNGNTGTSADEIKWGLRLYPTQVEVRESGVWKAGWAIEAGAVYKVAVEGGIVKYYQNGALKHTSEVAATYPLLVDATIETVDGSLENATLAGAE